MYRLYYSPGAASLAVHWMLIELGVPFELERIDTEAKQQKSPEYLALNPDGVVPTLIVDGAPMGESTAILMLLAERHGPGGLSPAPGSSGRAAYLQWMIYLANTLLPAFRAWFYPDEPASAEASGAAGLVARARIEGAWDRIDAQLARGGPHLMGETLTAADFLASMLMRWSRNMPKTATAWPNIATYLDRMRAMPSLREVHAREGLTDWIDA